MMCSSIIPFGVVEEYESVVREKDEAHRLSVTDFDRAVLTRDVCFELPKNAERLWLASEAGDYEEVERCVSEGMSVDAQDPEDGYCALLIAAECGRREVVRYLVESAGADPRLTDAFGRTPLYAAAVVGIVEMVEYLAPISDVECEDEDGRTAAWAALASRRLEAVEILRRAGADLSKRDKFGQSPREFASINGHADVLCFLDDFT